MSFSVNFSERHILKPDFLYFLKKAHIRSCPFVTVIRKAEIYIYHHHPERNLRFRKKILIKDRSIF